MAYSSFGSIIEDHLEDFNTLGKQFVSSSYTVIPAKHKNNREINIIKAMMVKYSKKCKEID